MDFIDRLQSHFTNIYEPSRWLNEIRQFCMKLQMENEHLWQELEENKRDLYHLQKENQELKESILQHIQRDITHMKTVVNTISKPPVESLD